MKKISFKIHSVSWSDSRKQVSLQEVNSNGDIIGNNLNFTSTPEDDIFEECVPGAILYLAISTAESAE